MWACEIYVSYQFEGVSMDLTSRRLYFGKWNTEVWPTATLSLCVMDKFEGEFNIRIILWNDNLATIQFTLMASVYSFNISCCQLPFKLFISMCNRKQMTKKSK